MGSDSKKKPHAAFVEDCDEEDKIVRGTKHSASTKGKSKEKSASSKSVRVDSLKVQPSTDRDARRKSTSSTSTRSPTKASRPSLARSNVTSPPKINTEMSSRPKDDPSYYGVGVSPHSTFTPNSSSARSPRPLSYYAGMPAPIPTSAVSVSRPPLSRSARYLPPSPMGVSYPLTSPGGSYMNFIPRPDPYYVSESPWQPNPLAERFTRGMDPINRTASAQGIRILGGQSGFELDAERRSIARQRTREAEDLMPPPALPVRRRSVTRVTDGRDSYDDGIRYDERAARTTYREPSPAPRAHRRSSLIRGSAYDYAGDRLNYRIEPSNKARRASYYEEQPAQSTYEDQMRRAAGYQEQVAGGPSVSLTAEALRKQELTTASSRSTRSSASRDESDFRRSATTRTTTSRIEDGEDVTIKFKGGATVNIAGAEIKCDDGAEVNIVRAKGAIRNGSERSGSEYGMVPADDKRSRDRRHPNYSRSTSKSGISYPPRTSYQQSWI